MKKYNILILFSLLLFSCTKNEYLDAFRSDINKFKIVQEKLDFAEGENYFATEKKKKAINEYFKVLEHIKIEDGFVLDWFFVDLGSDGQPEIFIRPYNHKTYNYFEEFEEDSAFFEPYKRRNFYYHNPILAKIYPDGTDISFYQYAIFLNYYDQFNLHWHAGYKETKIITEYDDLREELPEFNHYNFHNQLDDINFLATAGMIDFTPIIERSEEFIKFSYFIFNRWNGLFRVTLVFANDNDYKYIKTKSKMILEYDCGWMF